MVSSCAVCGCCTRTDIVREHLEDTLRICDVSAKGLFPEVILIILIINLLLYYYSHINSHNKKYFQEYSAMNLLES
jgi:hypothetical protein